MEITIDVPVEMITAANLAASQGDGNSSPPYDTQKVLDFIATNKVEADAIVGGLLASVREMSTK